MLAYFVIYLLLLVILCSTLYPKMKTMWRSIITGAVAISMLGVTYFELPVQMQNMFDNQTVIVRIYNEFAENTDHLIADLDEYAYYRYHNPKQHHKMSYKDTIVLEQLNAMRAFTKAYVAAIPDKEFVSLAQAYSISVFAMQANIKNTQSTYTEFHEAKADLYSESVNMLNFIKAHV